MCQVAFSPGVLLLLLLASCGLDPAPANVQSTGCATSSRPTLVVAALAYELAPIVSAMENPRMERVFGVRCYHGNFGKMSVIAAELGVGKVNASASVAVLIDRFEPSRILMTGTAGSLSDDLKVGDVVIGSQTVQNDLGTQYPQRFEPWAARDPADNVRMPLFYPADETLLTLAKNIAHDQEAVRVGIIASGDRFVSSDSHRRAMHRQFQSQAVDMESAAVAQICYRRQVPFLAVRCVTDAMGQAAVPAYRTHRQQAARRASRVVIDLVSRIAIDSPLRQEKP